MSNYPKTITSSFEYPFPILKAGHYFVIVSARCKSGKQAKRRGGNDLRMEIDGEPLQKTVKGHNQRQFNVPEAWNGTLSKNKRKTIITITYLQEGDHILTFIPKGEATIDQEPQIFDIQDIQHAILELNDTAEDGDRRPWITVVMRDMGLERFSADVSIPWKVIDSSDIKVIIDSKTIKNPDSWFHRDWVWAGSVMKKLKQQEREEKTFKESLLERDHLLEFWADRTPTLHKLTFGGGYYDVEKYRVPTVDDPRWTGDFRDDTEQMILARAIYGESRNRKLLDVTRIAIGWSIRNRVEDKRWGDTYHDVITQPWQYSAFNKTDKNRDYVVDPLHTGLNSDLKAWENCYQIAGKVIDGKVDNPVSGATHYYDNSRGTPYWANEKNFIVRFDNVFFHKL